MPTRENNKSLNSLIEDFKKILFDITECLAGNDINKATKKTHEALAHLKQFTME
jgi:hypothetical protein